MIIAQRLRTLRLEKNLSQGDVEKKTGLLRCYISRVENGHTIPSLETLERLAVAFEVPLYQLFYEGNEPPELPNLSKRATLEELATGESPKETDLLRKLLQHIRRIDEHDRKLLLSMAQKMASR